MLGPEQAALLHAMAGYRNRLTHFYDEVTAEELYDITTHRLGDVESVLEAILSFLRGHPELLDGSL